METKFKVLAELEVMKLAIVDWFDICYEPKLNDDPNAVHWATKQLADVARMLIYNDSLVMGRAKFVYEGARIAAIAAEAPIVPAVWDEREVAFKLQFYGIIEKQCGENRSTSPEELHESWVKAYLDMGWTWGAVYDISALTHPGMVPYDELGQLERDKDSVFVALCEIARQWIY